MRACILAFAFGIWLLQQMPSLPRAAPFLVAVILLAMAAAVVWQAPRRIGRWARSTVLVLLAFAGGLSWAAWWAEQRLADALPMSLEQQDVEVVGVVVDLPRVYDDGTRRFRLRVEHSPEPVPRHIQLSWYARGWGGERSEVPEIRPGQRWRLTVRLRRPHTLMNPHGRDREARLLERNIRAVGYVRDQPPHALLAEFVPTPMTCVHRLRDSVRARFQQSLSGGEYAGILIALAVGDQQAISSEHWEVFRRTAAAHLVSISGLHVSLVALFAGALAAWLWRRSACLLLKVPAMKIGAGAGLAAATLYALLAGLGLPTQRALIMLAVGAVALMLGRQVLGSRVLALALFCVLVADPWAVLSSGFWLSFGAVAVIIAVASGRMRPEGKLQATVRVQLAITLAMTPALFALFQAFSLVAPFANAVAIPLVSLVITPLVLAAIVLPWSLLLAAAHAVTALMMSVLQGFAGLPFAMWHGPAVPMPLIMIAVLGVACLLLPRGTPGRVAAWLALVPMLVWTPPRPAVGEFRVTVLDVGQGLAVHVQTAGHDLLYDTGPPFGPVSDAGRRVLLPYLGGEGVTRIDRLVLSHPHADHTGGASSVIRSLTVDQVMANIDPDHTLHDQAGAMLTRCGAGQRWEWDGVRFEMLYPDPDDGTFRSPNDASCVLKVSAAGGSVLLPGDVEMAAEWKLLRRKRAWLASDVVLAPHHGSRTSSRLPFVEAVDAEHVIHSAGNLNRFRHPHPEVWARWAEAGTRNWRTDAQGAITIRMGRGGYRISALRERERRYWHGR